METDEMVTDEMDAGEEEDKEADEEEDTVVVGKEEYEKHW